MPGLKVETRWNTAVVNFSAVSGAKDYRIYVLPSSNDIAIDASGLMTVRNAIYRCSGTSPSTNSPVLSAQWPGLTGATQLVIEALDKGCPDEGMLSGQAPAKDPYELKWKTLSQLQAASATGEVYVNGQVLKGAKPKAIARSIVSVSPQSPGVWDWSMDFSAGSAAASQVFDFVNCPPLTGTNCFQTWMQRSNLLDVEFNTMETGYFNVQSVLGELRFNFVDWANDTNGKIRVSPKSSTSMSADKFLHVTMATQAVTTGRRYPQIIISDQSYPISDKMVKGNSIVVQTRSPGNETYPVEVQVCDHARWEVNAQCPGFQIGARWVPGFNGYEQTPVPSGTQKVDVLQGWDRKVQFDVYASTKKVYVFVEGKPYGCVNLPTKGIPVGTSYVYFANVLYHSGASDSVPGGSYGNNQMHYQHMASFNNLGIAAAVSAPAWDEAAVPCQIWK